MWIKLPFISILNFYKKKIVSCYYSKTFIKSHKAVLENKSISVDIIHRKYTGDDDNLIFTNKESVSKLCIYIFI